MAFAERLTCEHAVNPLGLWTDTPLLAWQISSDPGAQAVVGSQVLVASSPTLLEDDQGDLWNSGELPAAHASSVEYAGAPLTSRQECWWKVRLVSEGGDWGEWSQPAQFEMSLLHPEDWTVNWTGRPGSANAGAIYLRQQFDLSHEVTKARLYVTGLGYYQARLNGAAVGDQQLAPSPTNTGKRLLFSTHDVTDRLRVGSNVLGAVLGHGWSGTQQLLAQLEITLADGSQVLVGTGQTGAGRGMWNALTGPIVSDSVYDGVIYDTRLERSDWDDQIVPDVAPMRSLEAAMVVDAPGGVLTPDSQEPIEVVQTRRPVTITEVSPGVHVIDTGQNLAGWLRVRVDLPAGGELTLRYAESVHADGPVNQENLRSAQACDRLVGDGQGLREWEPLFTYHGFRFVQIEGWPGVPRVDDIDVRVVRSAMARRAEFSCSDPLVSAIDQAVVWTEVSNLHGVPTDCPQRNERMGWLNDLGARTEELVYNFDTVRFLSKWMQDIADTQDSSGAIADTAPYRFGTRPGDPVSVCYALIPWLLITHHGDLRTAREHFDGMRRWAEYLTGRATDGILEYSHYGDWAPPVSEGQDPATGFSALAVNTPGPLVSTGHHHRLLTLMARISGALGRSDEAAAFDEQADQVKAAFNREFRTPAGYGTGNQACNSLALYMGLVPDDEVAMVVEALVSDIRARDNHVSTGNLCTKYLLEVLAEHGRGDVALDLVLQRSYPSWGYMLDQGATTIWERWEHETGSGMNSHNHPMYGSVGAWFHRWLAGIQVPDTSVAMSQVTIRPLFDGRLSAAASRVETVKGVLSSSWQRTDEGVDLTLEIPTGTTALLDIAGISEQSVGAGLHRVRVPGA